MTSLRYRTLAAYLAWSALDVDFPSTKAGPVANTGEVRAEDR